MVGKNKMKDWKACVRTWERDDKGKEKPVSKFINYDQKEYDYDKIQRKAIEAIVKEGKTCLREVPEPPCEFIAGLTLNYGWSNIEKAMVIKMEIKKWSDHF